MKFLEQARQRKDFNLWKRALKQLQYRHQSSLGRFQGSSHKLWEWQFDEDNNWVLRFHRNEMDIYTPSDVSWYANRPNSWTQSRVDQAPLDVGKLCTMHPVATAVWKISSSMDVAQLPTPLSSLREVFELLGCNWMWNDL